MVAMAAERPGSGSLVVFLHRGSWADRYQAVTLAVTAAALGEEVTLALFFEPLRLWAEARFDEGAPAEAAAARVVTLRETLDEARRELGLAVVACDTAARLAGPDPGAIRAAVDRIVTLPQLWKTAREGTYLVI
jgi:peroxiredoxin family protein